MLRPSATIGNGFMHCVTYSLNDEIIALTSFGVLNNCAEFTTKIFKVQVILEFPINITKKYFIVYITFSISVICNHCHQGNNISRSIIFYLLTKMYLLLVTLQIDCCVTRVYADRLLCDSCVRRSAAINRSLALTGQLTL